MVPRLLSVVFLILLATLPAAAQTVKIRSLGQLPLSDPQALLLARDGAIAVVERRGNNTRVTSFEASSVDGTGSQVTSQVTRPLDVRGRVLLGSERRLLVQHSGTLRVVGAVTGTELATWPAPMGPLSVTGNDQWWLVQGAREAYLIQQRTQRLLKVRLPDCPACQARLVPDGRAGVLIALDDSTPQGQHWLVNPTTGASARLSMAAVRVVDNLLFQTGPAPDKNGQPGTVVRAEDLSRYPALLSPARRKWGVPPAFRAAHPGGASLRLEDVLWDDTAKTYLFSGRAADPVYNVKAKQWQSLISPVRLFRVVQDTSVLSRVLRSGSSVSKEARYTHTSALLLEATSDRLNIYAKPAYTLRLSLPLAHARSYVFADLPGGLLLATLQEDGVMRLRAARVSFSRLTW